MKHKNLLSFVSLILLFPFLFFLLVSFFCGGSAFHKAHQNYEMYLEGHCYLLSHGDYTEVSQEVYRLVYISELIGIPSGFLAFVVAIVNDIATQKNKTFRLQEKPPQ